MPAMKPRRTRDRSDRPAPGEGDPTADTDPIDIRERVSLDYTGEFSTGTIDHDERGQARWKFKTEATPSGDIERTFDLLKALNNDALSIEGAQEPAAETKPKRKSGYNPYDVDSSAKPKPSKPPKPRE
jgi:hypothetical protein